MTQSRLTRRQVLQYTAAAGTALIGGVPFAPAISHAAQRPLITHGVQSGDVIADGAVLWSRTDRPARMVAEVATDPDFRDARRVVGPATLAENDFTAKLALSDLPPGRDIHYRIAFDSLADPGSLGAPVEGRFRTAPSDRRSVRFVWTGDVCGQGWGIDPDRGGLAGFEAMRHVRPDFFIHSGDTVYADQPLAAAQAMPDGGVWRNILTPEKAEVAETLAEFRGNHKYNLMDAALQRFNAEVPILAQWDDHETVNNWYPGEKLEGDDRYRVKNASLLAARANRAFHDFLPLRTPPLAPERIHRVIPYGPLLDIIFLDLRRFRGPNRAAAGEARSAILGRRQLDWLKGALRASKARWKVIAAGMPLGLVVPDGADAFEAVANADNGPPRGREREIAELLAFLKRQDIRNTVWLAADVHYTAAHYYDPNRAAFQDFLPFWEFVSGPIHAGTFGPNALDATFGPEVKFSKTAGEVKNLPPSAGLQFFGLVEIDGESAAMTVTLKDIRERDLYSVTLEPA